MKKIRFILMGVLLTSILLIFQYGRAQKTTQDFNSNLKLLNEARDSYILTECYTRPTLGLSEIANLICTEKIVPGTQNVIICEFRHAILADQTTKKCFCKQN